MSVSIVLLSYKEEENLKILIPQIQYEMETVPEDYEILVVDTKTPMDHTEDVCKALGARYINQEEAGFGGAFRTAIRHVEGDKFLIMDSDGSHPPSCLPSIYEMFTKENHDVVIGSRYVQGGTTEDAKSSVAMSKILNGTFRLFLGISAKDISTDFRMYRTADLGDVTLVCENYDVLQEVLLKLKLNNPSLTIGEVPIHFSKRVAGESKRRLIPFIFSYGKTLFRLTWLRIRHWLQSSAFRSLLRQITLYGVIGLFAAIVDFSVFKAINSSTSEKYPVIANIVATLSGFIVSFFLNTFVNFKKTNGVMKRFFTYLSICVFGMLISSTAIHFLQNLMNLDLLKVLCLAAVSIIQFVLNRVFTYGLIQ